MTDNDPAAFFPGCELAMLAHDVAVSRRLLEIESSDHPMDFGEEWDDVFEARAAFQVFRPCAWWRDASGREAWNVPVVE